MDSTVDLFPPWKVIIKPYPLLPTLQSGFSPQKDLSSKPVAIYNRKNMQKFNPTLIMIKKWTLFKFFHELHIHIVADWEPNVNRTCWGKEGGRVRRKEPLCLVHCLFFWQWENHRNPLGDQGYYTVQEHYRWSSAHKNTLQYFRGTLELINHAVKGVI